MKRKMNSPPMSDSELTQAMDYVEALDLQTLNDGLPQPKLPRPNMHEKWLKTSSSEEALVFDPDLLDWLALGNYASEAAWFDRSDASHDTQSSTKNPSPPSSTSTARVRSLRQDNGSSIDTLATLEVNLSELMAGVLQNIHTSEKTINPLFTQPTPSIKQVVQRAHYNLNAGFYAPALADYQHAYQAEHGPSTQLSYINLINGLRHLSQQERHYPRAQALLELAYLMMVDTSEDSTCCAQLLAELGQVHMLNHKPTLALNYFKASLRQHITQLQSLQIMDPRHPHVFTHLNQASDRQTLRQLNSWLAQWNSATDAQTVVCDANSLLMSLQSFPVGLSHVTLSTVGTMIPTSDHNADGLVPFAVLFYT